MPHTLAALAKRFDVEGCRQWPDERGKKPTKASARTKREDDLDVKGLSGA
jgi:hypothetical protein